MCRVLIDINATHAGILTSVRSTLIHIESFTAERNAPLPSSRECGKNHGFGERLSPVTLSAQNHSTSELLRTLSRVAASKPTSWLSVRLNILSH